LCHSNKGEERSEDLKEDTEMIGEFVYGLMQTEGDILPLVLRVALGIVIFARSTRPLGVLHRRHVHRSEKGGGAVGKTKRGKGTKLMMVADSSGLPLAVSMASASPHEVTLVQQTLESRFVEEKPKRLIGDRAYDSDPLDAELGYQGIEMIAPHRTRRKKPRIPRTGAS
jgi:hypothetical protein